MTTTARAAVPPLISTTMLRANTNLLHAAGVTRRPRAWNEVEGAYGAVRGLPGVTHSITWPRHGSIFQQAVSGSGDQPGEGFRTRSLVSREGSGL